MAPATSSSQSRSTQGIRWFHRLSFIPVAASLFISVAAGKYGGGSGIPTDPYLIRTAEELSTLGNTPGDWDKCFRLMADIDLEGYNETNFHLIGSWVSYSNIANQPYRGLFDGNRHTISNLQYRDMKNNATGLFRYVEGDVRNLTLRNVKMVTNGMDVGALVGRLGSGGVSNCHVIDADVTGDSWVGGLIGNAKGGVYQCSSRGRVAGRWYVGGLVGGVDDAIVARSYSKASVSGTESIGGLIGATLHQEAIVDSCYANGSVQGTLSVGGLAGTVVVGRVYKCYSTGVVTGTQSAGGLTGNMKVLGDVILSFWDVQTSRQVASLGGTGKNTAEMWSATTFNTWDFGNIWSICDGRNYPVLLWQIPTADLRCPDGVNGTDFAWFAIQWRRNDCGGANSDCEWTDFDLSGDVGVPDLAILAQQWLTGLY